jgi:hypothetical protein
MTTVTVYRRQEKFKRAINGGWLGNGADTEVFDIDEDRLRPHDVQYPLGVVRQSFSLGSGITVHWPDGVKEMAFPGNGGVGNYPPVCIPTTGRLASLLT